MLIITYFALAVFGLGVAYKVSTWFRYYIDINTGEISLSTRIFAAIKGMISTLFSMKIFTLLKVFILDVLLQVRTLREDFLRWFMHICIYVGFMLLLLMHALDKSITSELFPDYFSTINPFMFLRDLFGVLVILGLLIAVYRRFFLRIPRLMTNSADNYAIIIVAVIIFSGIILEGTKITSHSKFQQMVEDYYQLDDQEELKSLEAYWITNYGVISPDLKGPFKANILALGEELNEGCVECHSRPKWAFAGYGFAKIISPVAPVLDKFNAPVLLWYIHFLVCLLGLAYLPFSKMFHIFSSPLSLLTNAAMDGEKSDPANIATRQIMELDACTHCGTCNSRCSVAVAYEAIPNMNILPSEKISSVKKLAAGKILSYKELRDIQEGIYLCTNCNRCTVVCPVGINLQDLWFNVREVLLKKGYPEFFALSPLSFYRGLRKKDGAQKDYQKPLGLARSAIVSKCELMGIPDKSLPLAPTDGKFQNNLGLSVQANTFSACFGCETCTTACPVVANYENPKEVLGLLPHQIMHAAGLGIQDLAFGSNMLWDCLTCYQCQERCPQGVGITDILYELKNLAVKNVKDKTSV